MGMKQKVDELEAKLRQAESQLRCMEYLHGYIKKLAEMPEDAVLSYRQYGTSVIHEIGKSARVVLSMMEKALCAPS